jgi:two-component system cell cycle sensor histidine kinase/response regulator CckA
MIRFAGGAPSTGELLASPQVPNTEPHGMSATPRVLVTEDDDAVRRVILRVLGDRGYQVLSAGHMQDALEHWHAAETSAAAARIDLLITDYFMPGGTGRDLANALWATRPQLPVLFMSGYDEDTPPDFVAGREVHLAKPFTTGQLLEHVTQMLDLAGIPLPASGA